MSKKAVLARWLYRSGLIRAVMAFNRIFGRRLLILAYHRVHEPELQEEEGFGSDIDLVSASSRQFDWQVRYLDSHYDVVTFQEYCEIIQSGESIGDKVIITFDDGFEDNYDRAFPILAKYDIPAVFYVSTGYIGNDEPFWFEFIVAAILQVPDTSLVELARLISIESVASGRQEFAEAALERLKRVPDHKRLDVIESIRNYLEQAGLAVDCSRSKPMQWDHLLEMARGGMEFGSHTITHPILTNLSQEALDREIRDSKQVIENMLDAPCLTFSYPNGGPDDINEAVTNTVAESGYRFACSYISGANRHANLSKFALKRLHVERYVENEYFAAMLALPWLFK